MKKLLTIIVAGAMSLTLGFAAPGDEEETSTLQNAAQAQKAENLAQASLAEVDQEAVDAAQETVTDAEGAVGDAETAVADAETALETANTQLANATTDDEIEAANTAIGIATSALETANSNLETANNNLETATGALAAVSGVTQEDIEGMRASGMGWGEIAHELGVHPSVLGLGHAKQMAKAERSRSAKGFDADSATASNGAGKAYGLSGKASKSTDKSNNGSDKGNKGGKSNGNNGNGKDK